MGKMLADSVLDGLLDEVASATRVSVCSAEPSSFGNIGSVALAQTSLSPSDFSKSANPGGGRRLTISGVNDVDVSVSGTANHVAWDDGVSLLAVTTIASPQALTMGNKVSVASVVLSVSDPS